MLADGIDACLSSSQLLICEHMGVSDRDKSGWGSCGICISKLIFRIIIIQAPEIEVSRMHVCPSHMIAVDAHELGECCCWLPDTEPSHTEHRGWIS